MLAGIINWEIFHLGWLDILWVAYLACWLYVYIYARLGKENMCSGWLITSVQRLVPPKANMYEA